MNRLKTILLALPILLAACSSTDDITTDKGKSVMKVNVGINTTRNVTPYTATTFGSGAQLGVRVIDGAGTTGNYNFQNALYTSGVNEENEQIWTLGTFNEDGDGIIITENYAKAMAYYPWTENLDAAAIPIDCSTETDWMYCTWRPQFNYTTPTVSFAMQHAQSIIKVVFQNAPSPDTYTGNMTLKKLTVEGSCLARAGTLNATTGALSSQTGNSYVINYTTEQLGTFAAQQDYVLTTGTSGTITFTLEIGTSKYSATTAALTLQQGYIYQYVLTISDTKLIIDPVTIIPWVNVESITIEGEEQES